MSQPAWNPITPGSGPSSRRGGGGGGDGPRPAPFVDPETGFRGWTLTLPERRGLATPAVGDGRVLVGAGFGTYHFWAFDCDSGEAQWCGRTRDDGPTAGVLSGNRVAFNTESCTVCVLDTASGDLVWERWLGDPLLSQPAAADGRLFIAWPSNGLHRLGAFDLETGEPLWDTGIGSDVITTPVVSEGIVYASTYDGSVSSFDAATGKQRSLETVQATSAPWIHDGEIFVSQRDPDRPSETPWEKTSGHRHTGARRQSRDVSASRRARYLESKRLHTELYQEDLAHDASVGFGQAPAAAKLGHAERLVGEATVHGAWRFQGSRPCVCDGRLFSVIGDVLTASDVKTGDELWRWEQRIGGSGHRALSPPAAVPGRVYAGGRDGRLYSWDADSGALRWSAQVGARASFQPAIVGGHVYAGLEGGRLVAFSTGDAADDGWSMWGGGPGHNGA